MGLGDSFKSAMGALGGVLGSGLGELDRKEQSQFGNIDPANFQLQGEGARGRSLLQQADFAAGRGLGRSGFQNRLLQSLQDRAAGRGPSVAQQQLKQGLGRNVSTQQALLATGGPGAARAAAQQASAQGASLAGQGAMLRAQEMTQAQGLLGQVAGQARDQDLRARGLNDQQIARLRELELRNAELGLRGRMGLEQQRTSRYGADLGVPTQGEQLLSGIGGLTSLLGFGG